MASIASRRVLPLTVPALVSLVQPLYHGMLITVSDQAEEGAKTPHVLGGLLQHVVTVPAGDGDERNRLGVVADLLDEGGRLLDDFVETVLGPLKQQSVFADNRMPSSNKDEPWS